MPHEDDCACKPTQESLDMSTKICPRCKEEKALTFDHWYRSKQTKSGFKGWCKACTNTDNEARDTKDIESKRKRSQRVIKSRNRSADSKQKHVKSVVNSRSGKGHKTYRNNKLKNTYGITNDEYLSLLEDQGNGCAICNKTPEEEGKYLAVDHCHETSVVRGLLCQNCNHALGKFKDDPNLLYSAIDYLEGR